MGRNKAHDPKLLHGIHRFKDVRAHCYCAFLLRTLFIRHAHAPSYIKHVHRAKHLTKCSADGRCVGARIYLLDAWRPPLIFWQITSFYDSQFLLFCKENFCLLARHRQVKGLIINLLTLEA